MPTGGPPLTEIVQLVALPLPLVVKDTSIALKPCAPADPAVSCGALIVFADALAGGPAPASLTARTVTVTVAPSARPVSVTALVPVTSWLLPPTVTTYLVTGRPLASAGCQATAMLPLASTVCA